MTIYQLPEIVNEAWGPTMTVQNIISGFAKAGIYPYNPDTFQESDFCPSSVTDWDNPLQLEPSRQEHQPGSSHQDQPELSIQDQYQKHIAMIKNNHI